MKRIRVLLAELPSVVQSSLKQVVGEQADMEIVGEVGGGVGLLLAAGATQADVVLMGLRDLEVPGICSHLVTEYPHIKVLAVSGDGRRAFLYELRPQKVPIGEVSAEELLEAIRAAIQV